MPGSKLKNGKKPLVSQEQVATAALPFALAFDAATLPIQLAAIAAYQATKRKQPNEASRTQPTEAAVSRAGR